MAAVGQRARWRTTVNKGAQALGARQPRRARDTDRAQKKGNSTDRERCPRSRLEVKVQGRKEVHERQYERVCRALRFYISSVIVECTLWNTTSAETTLRFRAMDSLGERKTVNVSWEGRPQALHTIGV